ncbi:DUF397 domain-containing protein [Streptomyces scabiei]|uniref:DUF397 domain-containing protein n=1 Tax=Streptomyces scabiei TaxID=1930 RepID=UPI003676FB2C
MRGRGLGSARRTWVGNCLEVAEGHPAHIPVRDSKDPLGPALVFRAEAWSAFVDGLKRH